MCNLIFLLPFFTGTFALESDKVVYGLVVPIKTFDILYVQVNPITWQMTWGDREEKTEYLNIQSHEYCSLLLLVCRQKPNTMFPHRAKWVLVHAYLKSLCALSFQFHYYLELWNKSNTYKSISDKLLTFVNGPSWKPGKSRLGDHSDNPQVNMGNVRQQNPLARTTNWALQWSCEIFSILFKGLWPN